MAKKKQDESKDVDRVAMPSVKADGEPDQTEGFETLVDDEE